MIPQPPPGQGPIDPRSAFAPPAAPGLPSSPAASSQSAAHSPPASAPASASNMAASFPSGPSAGPSYSPHTPNNPPQSFGPPPGQYPPGFPPPGNYGPPMGYMQGSPYPPQPIIVMQPAPKSRRGFAMAIFTSLAGLMFTASLLLNFYFLSPKPSPAVIQTVVAEGDATQKIAVVPIKGTIAQPMADKFDAILTSIEKDPSIKALVLEIDTPGGGVSASDQMYARVNTFKGRKGANFPVVISMGQLATSGGYYIACSGNHLIAQPSTLTGNIGVLMPRYNISKLAEKYGVEEATITAPHQGFKNAGSMFAPVNAKDTQYLQALIDEMYANFKTVVTTGRGTKLAGKIDDIADGKVYTATQAKSLGLVDDIGYADKAYAYAAKSASLSNPTLIRYSPRPPSFFDAFGAESSTNLKTNASSGVTINGVNVTIDSGLLEELGRPRALYLWRGQ